VISKIKRHGWLIAFCALLFVIFILNSVHASYPDEFDNILGGKLILEGILPYKGFFSHHGPLAYFLSAVINLFSGVSFVRFRLLYALFLLLFSITTYLVTKSKYILLFFLGLAISSTYLWANMMLADTLSGILLIPGYALLFLRIYHQEKLSAKDLIVVSLSSSAALLNSMTYTYSVAVMVLATAIYHVRSLKSAFRFSVIISLPYFFFGLYLLVTGSLSDFLFQALDYNRKYYIYNYPRPEGSTAFNPIRYAVVILNNFLNNMQIMATGIFNFVPRYPLVHVLGFTNIILWAWLLIRKKYLLFALCSLLLAFSTARGNPSDIRPTDYQTGVYFILTLLHASFLVSFFRTEKLPNFLLIFFSILWFFGATYLGLEFWRINYDRYMGKLPLIYDRPLVAGMVNQLVPKDHYCWVGPFEFEELYYLNCKAPSKYHWILPQFAGIEKIKQEIIADYGKNVPDVIVFRRDYSAFGQSSAYSAFFVDFLNQNYVRPKELGYRFLAPRQKDFTLDEDFNIRKDLATQYVIKLVNLGHINSAK